MKHLQAGRSLARRPGAAWTAKSCLLAVPLCASLLPSCKGEATGAAEPMAGASGGGPATVRLPYHYDPGATGAAEPATSSPPVHAAPPLPVPAAAPPPPAQAASPVAAAQPGADAYALLPALNAIISARMSKEGPKMRLSPEKGRLAQEYAALELPRSPQLAALASRMPKTAIELCRAVHERGVARADADGIAGYLALLLDSMRIGNTGKFDECCSHVMGRRWGEIDYSGEGIDWRRQERFYSSKGAPDLLTPEHVRAYFAVESGMPYFRKAFRPQGALPP